MSDGFDELVGIYGFTDIWVYVPDELTREQLDVLDALTDNYHDTSETPCWHIFDDDVVEPVLSKLREWGKRHELEKWSRWPTTWLPEGRNSARYSPVPPLED